MLIIRRPWLILGIVLLWVGTGLLGFGITLASFQHDFPLIAKEDCARQRRELAFLILAGPAGLVPIGLRDIPFGRVQWRCPGQAP